MAKIIVEVPDDMAGEALTMFCQQQGWNGECGRVEFARRKILDFYMGGIIQKSLDEKRAAITAEIEARMAQVDATFGASVNVPAPQ